MAGAPTGNTNATKGKPWRDAINQALKKREKSRVDGKKALDELAETLLTLCDEGDLQALKEMADRIEGKPAQAIVGGDENDNPVKLSGVLEFIGKDG